MRIALAVLMILHGIAHLPGFLVPWRLASPEGMQYKTTILAGRLDAGASGIRIIGVLWLLTAIGFVVAGLAAIASYDLWRTLAVGVACISLLLSILSLPEAKIGAILNPIILALILAGEQLGWFGAR